MSYRRPHYVFIFLGFIWLLVLSYYYYLERVVMPDMTFHLFEILSKDKFAIQNNRFVAILTQIFPYFGAKLGLSIKTIAICYSLSFPILYMTISICLMKWKNYELLTVFFLYQFLICASSFFWPISEIHQGVSVTFLLFGLLERNKFQYQTSAFYFFSFILIPIILFSYPLMTIVLTVFLSFYALNKESIKPFVTIGAITIFILIIKFVFFDNEYEVHSMGRLRNFKNISDWSNMLSVKKFSHYLLRDYIGFTVAFCYLTCMYFIRKEWLKLAWVLVFSLGLIFLINVSFQDGAEQFYLEGQFMILSLIVGLPLAYDFIPKWNKRIASVFLLLVITFFAYRVVDRSQEYSLRLDTYRSIINQSQGQKLILKSNDDLREKLKMTWCSSYELWLLSTIESQITSSIIIKDNPEDLNWALSKNKSFFTEFELVDYSCLNQQYFVLRDTGYYRKN